MLLAFGPRERQHLIAASRRRWRRILSTIALLWVFTIYARRKHPFSFHPHALTASDIHLETQLPSSSSSTSFLSFPASQALCSAHKWAPYPLRDRRRKIYDLIMLNTEKDMLEIRLETMAAHVDYFVILQSTTTFTGLVKPLILQEKENWGRVEKWQKQIIYKVVEGMPVNAARTWDLEDFQRNAMMLQGVLGVKDEDKMVQEGDVLIVADVDEIVRPAALRLLRECDIPSRITLRSKFYYYGFQFMHRGEEWAHPQATVYKGNDTILPADLRNGEGGNRVRGWWDKADLWNAGWHCSSCFSTVEDMLNKMQSFSHTSLNQEVFRDKARIVDRVREGKDLWDREGEIYDKIKNNEDIPEFLKGEGVQRRFRYLLDREGVTAGFTDYKVPGS